MPANEASRAVVGSPFEAGLPCTFTEKSSRLAAAALLILAIPVIAIIAGPVSLIVTFAAEDVRHAIADKPLAVSMLAMGMMAWAALFLFPMHRLIKRFCTTRNVQIVADRVCVKEASLLGFAGWRIWCAPPRSPACATNSCSCTAIGTAPSASMPPIAFHNPPSTSRPDC